MRKIYVIIIVLILIVTASFFTYQFIIDNGKKYDIESVEQYNYFVLKQNDLYGVINRKGEVLVEPEYGEIKIPNPEKDVFICYQEDKIKILNEQKEEILTKYNNVEPIRLKNIASDLMYEKSVLKYEKDGKYGLISFDGKEITKPIYDEIDSLPFKEGELIVKQNEKNGIINIKGNKLIEINYDKIAVDGYYTTENRYKYSGYIVAIKTEEGYRYGYINYKGKKILETEYNEMERVAELIDNENIYIICAKNGQYGIMKNEETVLNNEYQSIEYDNTNKVFVIEKSKKYGVINQNGDVIVPIQYNQIDITGIYLYAQNEQGTTVYNNDGTQAKVDSNIAIINTKNERYKIKINNKDRTKYGVVDQDGKELIEEKYNYIEYLYDNYFIISSENGKLGIIDDEGNIKIDTKYDSLQKIQNTDLIQTTLAESKIIQVYSKKIEKICEMQNAVLEVKDSYIKIYSDTETKYFSLDGKELNNKQVYPNNKLFVVKQDSKYGYEDNNGNAVVNFKYDKACEFNEYGYAAVKKDNKWGVVDEQGNEVIAPTYDIKDQTEPSFIGKYYKITYGFGEFYYTN